MITNNRLSNLFAPGTQSQHIERALITLEFCDAIMRIHAEAGAAHDDELSSLTRLEMWAAGVLRQSGYSI